MACRPSVRVRERRGGKQEMRWIFRLSHWLTFTLAMGCLAVVDTAVPTWLYPALVLTLTLLMVNPRPWHINATLANLLGLALIVVWLIWVGSEFYHQEIEGLTVGEDWLRVGFLRGGTLLALLLLAKWLRPRSAVDYWMMHALALVQVVLACATLVARPEDLGYRWFPGLLLAYLASGVWAVMVLHWCSERESGDPADCVTATSFRRNPATLPQSAEAKPPALGLLTAVWWCALGLVLAVILFLSTPRIGNRSVRAWIQSATMPQFLTGLSSGIDLTSGESLRLSDELVLRLDALDAEANHVWLGDQLRLRVLTCSVYGQGKWRPSSLADLNYIPYRYPIRLGAGQYRLQFQVDLTKLPSAVWLDSGGDIEELQSGRRCPLPLAEPHPALIRPAGVWFWSEMELAGVGLRPREPAAWAALLGSGRLLRYEQLYDPHLQIPETTLESSRISTEETPATSRSPRNFFSSFPLPGLFSERLDTLPRDLLLSGRIHQVATEVLRRYRLPPGAIPGESADQVLAKAQILEHYLANNPEEFVYTLSRPRKNLDLDPTEEFLLVPVTEDGKKAGWCQHYASALALLLRSQRVPARIVVGFRSGDWNPAWKIHEVRAYHAHAWVEAFIGPREADGSIVRGRWISFDPTPGAALTTFVNRQTPWWKMLAEDLRYLWDIVVLDGTTGQGFRSFGTVNALLDKLRLANVTDNELLWALARSAGGLALALAALLVWWRLRAHRNSHRDQRLWPMADWERALLNWLACILPPRLPGQSLLEYARAAQDRLMHHPGLQSELASLPVRMTELYYRYRFAQELPQPDELATLQRQLLQLGQFLDQLQRTVSSSSQAAP